MVTISKTSKGTPLLLNDGFCYILDHKTDEKILWKCEVQRKLNCHARLHTSLDNKVILKLIDTHNHSGNARSQHIRQFYENMKDEALQNHINPYNVLTQCYMGVPDEIRAILPNNSNLKRDVRRWRQDK
ncbi:unnamed protein product [Didymodactylos carnosus]|uniref:FLYWCH-type domain-containing protein n=1 Tax=Didymodactylos carnosus TaxID=1234261 RepID=A0A814PKL5_9BILA|nr:unnamed protein product [Didymodactylos carnosus]CAF3871896.1 unnamed protein product [Didymodactylos carnosus]